MDYFLIKPNGEQTGTYTIEQVRAMLAAGYIGKDTRYWHEGITEWQPIGRIEESLQFVPPAPVLKAIPPPATRIETSKKGKAKQRKPEGPSVPATPIPPTTRIPKRSGSPPITEQPLTGERATHDVSVAPHAAPKTSSKIPPLFERLLCLILGALLMLAVLRGPALLRYISDKFADKVVLTDSNNFVLLDALTIKPFTQAMQSSPMVASLQNQITQTTDPIALDRLKIGVKNENSRHADEIQQQYLRANTALKIAPGTYHVHAYYDDQGAPTTPHKDQAVWVAIPYRNQTVYALRAAEAPHATP